LLSPVELLSSDELSEEVLSSVLAELSEDVLSPVLVELSEGVNTLLVLSVEELPWSFAQPHNAAQSANISAPFFKNLFIRSRSFRQFNSVILLYLFP